MTMRTVRLPGRSECKTDGKSLRHLIAGNLDNSARGISTANLRYKDGGLTQKGSGLKRLQSGILFLQMGSGAY